MKNKNKNIALFFTAVIICPLFILVYFPIREKILQHQAVERMETASLERLAVHKDSLVWAKQGKEILYQHNLYDVKTMQVFGDSIVLSVLLDRKEMELHALKKRLNSSNNNDGVLIHKQVLKLFWTFDSDVNNDVLSITTIEKDRFPIYVSSLEEGIIQHCYSPPKCG